MGKKISAVLMTAILSSLLITGCTETEAAWTPITDNTIKIAVVGDKEYIEEDNFMNAVQFASDKFYESTGIKIEAVIYDDNAEYNEAIACAKRIAEDNTIAAVLVKQELDFIDSAAEIFDNAEKPFFLIDGCYESTIESAYDYMIVDCINAGIAGELMAKYVSNQGYKNIAFCHSDTEYEEDELKSFQKSLSDDVRLVDTLIGPYSTYDFNVAYSKWVTLGVDAVCISNYDITNSDLVKDLRLKNSDIPVIGDYAMDSSTDIEKNGEYLDKTVIIGRYVNGEINSEIATEFKENYNVDMTESDIQAYDIVTIIGNEINSGLSNPSELIYNIKNNNGYTGVSGTLKFDENGCLIPNGNEILVFSDGIFS